MNLTWLIETLWVRPVEGSLTDVVVTAAWRCSGTDGTYNGSVYATVTFAPPSGIDFTPFDQLTQQQVLNWIWLSGVDKDAAEAAVKQQIEQQKNPPIITPPLPWPAGGVDASTIQGPVKIQADPTTTPLNPIGVDPFKLPTSNVDPSVDGMSTKILG